MLDDILSDKERELLAYDSGEKPKENLQIDSGHFSQYRKRIGEKLQNLYRSFGEPTGLIRLDSAGYLSGEPLTEQELNRRRRWLTLYELSDYNEYLDDLSDNYSDAIREIGETETELEWWDAWIKLLDAGRMDKHIRLNWSRNGDNRRNRAPWPLPYRIDGYALGKRLGQMITRLAPNEEEVERIRTDIVIGFTDGVASGLDAEGWEELSEKIGEHLEDTTDTTAEDEAARKQSRKAHVEASNKAVERIRDGVPDDVDASEWLVWWIHECIKPETRMRSIGATDFSYPEKAEPDVIQSIIEEYCLLTKQRLKSDVEADIERLGDSDPRGISGSWLDVLEAVHDGKASSQEVAGELEGNVYHGSVTEAANRLTDSGWAHPLLRGDRTGWKVTPYGRVVVESMNSLGTWYDFDPRSPEDSWINCEPVKRVLDEIDQ